MFNNTDTFKCLKTGEEYRFGMTVDDENANLKGFALINLKTGDYYARVYPSETLPEQISTQEFRYITVNTHEDFIRL
jgi:hypothetical protein